MKTSSLCPIALALILTLLTACNTADVTSSDSADTSGTSDTVSLTEHVHTASVWNRDNQNHWELCECGEIASDMQAHTVDDECICTVCGSLVDDYGDGTCYVFDYNETGDILRASFYEDNVLVNEENSTYLADANGDTYQNYLHSVDFVNGIDIEATYNEYEDIMTRVIRYTTDNVVKIDRWEREYTEDGKQQSEKQYRDDVLVSELSDYAVSESDGYFARYPTKMTEYNDDGTRFLTVNGEWGMPISETTYAADGSVITETTYVWAFDDNANTLDKQVFIDGVLVADEDYAYDDFGYTYVSKQTEYCENNTTRVTYYEADGSSNYVIYNADGAVIEES